MAVALVAVMLPAARPQQVPGKPASFVIPAQTRQLIVGIAPSWDANTVQILRFERRPRGRWTTVGDPWPGRIGRTGLAWGRGLHPLPPGVPTKAEGDLRSPAGVFGLGAAFGYAPDVERDPSQRYVQVGPRDLMVDDPDSPLYNRHVRLDREPSTPWERDQQMEQRDPAHALQLFIEHNVDPVMPGAGSAILFHNWRRDGNATTAGCTALPPEHMAELVGWVAPARHPLYVLLPLDVYRAVQASWRLPAIDTAPVATAISVGAPS